MSVPPPRTSLEARALAAQLLSDRHRKWGYDCPAVDLDFVSYADGNPIALIEYKHEAAGMMSIPTMLSQKRRPFAVLRKLADMAGLPFFICRYAADFTWFRVQAGNDRASVSLPHRAEFDEVDWVFFVYGLSGKRPPKSVQAYLKGQRRLDL